MEAGRELDALIAEKVLGECIYEIWYSHDGVLRPEHPNGLTYECQNREQAKSYLADFDYSVTIMEPNTKPYSTDISAAWEVIEKLESLGCVVVIQKRIFPCSTTNWECTVTKRIEDEMGCFFNHCRVCNDESVVSAPHAICLAALKAVGVDIDRLLK